MSLRECWQCASCMKQMSRTICSGKITATAQWATGISVSDTLLAVATVTCLNDQLKIIDDQTRIFFFEDDCQARCVALAKDLSLLFELLEGIPIFLEGVQRLGKYSTRVRTLKLESIVRVVSGCEETNISRLKLRKWAKETSLYIPSCKLINDGATGKILKFATVAACFGIYSLNENALII